MVPKYCLLKISKRAGTFKANRGQTCPSLYSQKIQSITKVCNICIKKGKELSKQSKWTEWIQN